MHFSGKVLCKQLSVDVYLRCLQIYVLVIMADSKLGLADFIAVALYFAAVVGAGLYVSLKFFVDLHTLVRTGCRTRYFRAVSIEMIQSKPTRTYVSKETQAQYLSPLRVCP